MELDVKAVVSFGKEKGGSAWEDIQKYSYLGQNNENIHSHWEKNCKKHKYQLEVYGTFMKKIIKH